MRFYVLESCVLWTVRKEFKYLKIQVNLVSFLNFRSSLTLKAFWFPLFILNIKNLSLKAANENALRNEKSTFQLSPRYANRGFFSLAFVVYLSPFLFNEMKWVSFNSERIHLKWHKSALLNVWLLSRM